VTSTRYFLGIDLGTTFTAAAVARGDRVEISPLGNRAASIPTLVFLREDQTVLTGEAAERRGASEPARLAREFKRRVGDSVPIMLGEAPYSAERLMAALLKDVVAAVATREGGQPAHVAVTHPANWGPYKIELLRHALDLADLRDVTLVTEPVAAAMHYGSTERVEPGELVAVYDLGGGTFDAAVLEKTATGFAARGEPEGIERLGGIDFDQAVMAHVRNVLGELLTSLDPDEPAVRGALARLRQECVAAKEALSFDSDTSISVLLPHVQTDIRITRAEFEPMIRAAIDETIEALRRTLDHAGVRPADLAAVLLVGGSSQIPLVGELVSNALGRPVAVDAHPKHTVALGAALAAAATQAPVAAAPPTPVRAAANDEEPAPGTVAAAVTPIRSASRATAATTPRKGFGRRLLIAAAATVAVVGIGAAGYATTTGKHGARTKHPATSTPVAHVQGPDCHSASGRCAFITNVQLAGDRYVADYVTAGFDPLIDQPGTQGTTADHDVHFFFDTTLPQNAGTNGRPPGRWWTWDRPSGRGQLRFDQARVADGGAARRLCILVADPQNAVEPDSGNCVALPGPPPSPTTHRQPSRSSHHQTSTTSSSTTTTTQPRTRITFPSQATAPQGVQP
jgi:actin-like ATPase involved in cell morphogenesis